MTSNRRFRASCQAQGITGNRGDERTADGCLLNSGDGRWRGGCIAPKRHRLETALTKQLPMLILSCRTLNPST